MAALAHMLEWIGNHLAALGALGASATFIWSAIQFFLGRRQDRQTREFEAFHRLIKELVEPDERSGATWVDRQVAVVFELRHFPRYFEVTYRILAGLREAWGQHQGNTTRLLEEMDRTLSYIRKQKPNKALNATGAGTPAR
jgi:hypothetical protein